MNSPPARSQDLRDAVNGKIVRRASIGDIEAVMELAREIPTVAQWCYDDYTPYCATGQQTGTQVKALFLGCTQTQQSPHSGWGNIAGFAAFSAVPDAGGGECSLENMAVAEPWRRQGIALRLLAAGQLWCCAWCPADSQGVPPGSCMSLEVRAINSSALAFYELAGFRATGRRLAYYRQPDDDAILMWKSLNSSL